LEVINTNHIITTWQRLTTQGIEGIEGGLQVLVQALVLRLSLQTTLGVELLSLGGFSFKTGNFFGQPISFRHQHRFFGRKIVQLSF
jgi:hypothetical protein